MSHGFWFRLGWELAPLIVVIALLLLAAAILMLRRVWWIITRTPCNDRHYQPSAVLGPPPRGGFRCVLTRGHAGSHACAWHAHQFTDDGPVEDVRLRWRSVHGHELVSAERRNNALPS